MPNMQPQQMQSERNPYNGIISPPSGYPKNQTSIPPGYTLVPVAYLQQMQMAISQMYSQISAITTAQNSLQQIFNAFIAQRNGEMRAKAPSSGLPSFENPDELARWISNITFSKAKSAFKNVSLCY